jgi:hypothetical protein
MFTSNHFKDSNVFVIESRDKPAISWIYFLYYIYTGNSPDLMTSFQWPSLQNSQPQVPFMELYPITTTTVTIIISLLQIADQYLNPYLKVFRINLVVIVKIYK